MLLLAKLFCKKVVFHIHSSRFYDFFLSDKPVKSFIVHLVFRYSNLVIVLCKDWEIKLIDKFKDITVKTLHNPININEYKNDYSITNEHPELRILFLAFLIEPKGILDIIDLAKLIKKNSINNIHIKIGGKGELEETLVREITRYGLSDILEFCGWADSVKKKELLINADVFFLPSYNEGMPISILEAISSGLPILSTNIAGIPDLVQNNVNGYLLNPGDVKGYYNVLLDWANDKAKLKAMGHESLKIAQNFNSGTIFDQMLALYEMVSKPKEAGACNN
jgi:glycosyltransferase involved in cell wall biosynthesis